MIQAFTGSSINSANGAVLNPVIYQWTALFYGHAQVITPSMGWINFTTWYFICSLGINTLLQRVLGIQTQASGGMENMLSGQKGKALQFPEV